jgi:hypothetical protein
MSSCGSAAKKDMPITGFTAADEGLPALLRDNSDGELGYWRRDKGYCWGQSLGYGERLTIWEGVGCYFAGFEKSEDG